METKKAKYENLIAWVNATGEGFTAKKASSESNMPNKTTCIHIFGGLAKDGLLTASRSKNEKMFTKTPEWDVQKAIDANKARIRAKVEKRKLKQKPEPKQESKPEPAQKTEVKPKQKTKKQQEAPKV
jgi:hypothetical protein